MQLVNGGTHAAGVRAVETNAEALAAGKKARHSVSHAPATTVNRPTARDRLCPNIPGPAHATILPRARTMCDNRPMHLLELTLPTPEQNLALDEALLDQAEESPNPQETLRLWESPRPVVVVGRSSRVDVEIDRRASDALGIPILRRSSGGAAVVVGPGCLMYAVVLSLELRPELKDLSRAHAFVLGRLARGLAAEGLDATCAGTSDLVMYGASAETARKFSGNSLRAKRRHLLYHGTLLYDFDLSLIATCLKMPLRQPYYRKARVHGDFVANQPCDSARLRSAVLNGFPVDGEWKTWPRERVAALVAERFQNDDWNFTYPRSNEVGRPEVGPGR
jgi:lipoate-protein ligase A